MWIELVRFEMGLTPHQARPSIRLSLMRAYYPLPQGETSGATLTVLACREALPRVYLAPCGRGYEGRVSVAKPWPKLVRGKLKKPPKNNTAQGVRTPGLFSSPGLKD
jgi:hypothetical protein